MIRFIRILALTASLITLTDGVGSAKSGVEIKISGRYFAEPATVQMIIAVEPASDNRTLRVEADGDNMYCATEVPLSGSNEKRLHTIQFKNLMAGEYTLRAQVLSTSSVTSQATEEIMVSGAGAGGW